MNRKTYVSDNVISLVEYLDIDNFDNYIDWLDKDTQRGYNYEMRYTFEQFLIDGPKHRFIASILLKSNNTVIGIISISPMDTIPDLSIKIYKPYRK